MVGVAQLKKVGGYDSRVTIIHMYIWGKYIWWSRTERHSSIRDKWPILLQCVFELTHEANNFFLQYVNVCGVEYTVCSLYGYYAGWLYYNVWKSSCYDVMHMFTGYMFLFRLYCGQRKKCIALSLRPPYFKMLATATHFFVVGTPSRRTTNGTNIIRLWGNSM